MAVRTPPSWLQGGSHTAENDRNLTAFQISAGGIIDATDLAVTAPGGTMTVSVAAGACFIKGSRAYQGVYHAFNDAPVSLTIAASDPTNARYDRVVAEIKDAAYSGSTNAFQINVYQGTASSSPVEPTIPADSIELARITVPAAATAISTGNILDRRVRVAKRFAERSQGLAANVPAAGNAGSFFYTTDTDLISYDDGTARHDFPSKAVTDAAYVATAGGSVVTASGAAVKPLVLKGAGSQSANLLEVQNSGAALLVYTGPNGDFFSQVSATLSPLNASAKPLVVKGFASQSANLQEWQNSAGTVLSSIGPNGDFFIQTVAGTNRQVQVGAVDSGGAGFRLLCVAN